MSSNQHIQYQTVSQEVALQIQKEINKPVKNIAIFSYLLSCLPFIFGDSWEMSKIYSLVIFSIAALPLSLMWLRAKLKTNSLLEAGLIFEASIVNLELILQRAKSVDYEYTHIKVQGVLPNQQRIIVTCSMKGTASQLNLAEGDLVLLLVDPTLKHPASLALINQKWILTKSPMLID